MPNKKKYRLAVFIGRFQPFHDGHAHAVAEALKVADQVLILVGSSFQPRTAKNPFTLAERAEMILDALSVHDHLRIMIRGIEDHPYHDQQWIAGIQEVVDEYGHANKDIVLVGHEKDESSYYLKIFPQWDQIDTGLGVSIDATKLREWIFNGEPEKLRVFASQPVVEYIKKWCKTQAFEDCREDWHAIIDYKVSWAPAPYAPTFVTVDAVVVQSGHVLLIRRGKSPGRGLWALPGGFVEQNERLLDAAIRELQEETSIKLQPDTIRRCFNGPSVVFDAPGRDLRGRCFTHAHLFSLNDAAPLPKIKAADDAMEAAWVPLSQIRSENMYSDHYHIIHAMLGKL